MEEIKNLPKIKNIGCNGEFPNCTYSFAALSDDGELFTWGCNENS